MFPKTHKNSSGTYCFGAETVVKPTLINHDRRYVFIHHWVFRVLYYHTNKQLARLLRNLGEVGCD